MIAAPGWLAASSIVVGAFTPGIGSRATASFALFQAAAAYGSSGPRCRRAEAGLAAMAAFLLDVSASLAARVRARHR